MSALPRLTDAMLEAILEALTARIADELDFDKPTIEDYERAADWVSRVINNRREKD